MSPMPIDHPELVGRVVTLTPLTLAHVPALWAVAQTIPEAAQITLVPTSEADTERYVRDALDGQSRGVTLPYAIRSNATGDVVGTTRFANIERWHLRGRKDAIDVVEIGWTWLAADAQRTAINTEAKLLMLTHAFDRFGVHRVTIKTDALNQRSRAAIERIGARLEGILRSHLPSATGGVRDTAMYSIIASEWSSVRERLHTQLGE